MFPVAGPRRTFGVLRCTPAPDDSPVDEPIALIIGGMASDARNRRAREVLAITRSGMPHLETRRVRVRLRIEGDAAEDIDGGSWEMALGIADRLCLEGAVVSRRIFATGTMTQHGTIGEIAGLTEKLRHVEEVADPGDTFVFPAANQAALTTKEAKTVTDLRARGVVVHAVTRFAELGFLWHPAPS